MERSIDIIDTKLNAEELIDLYYKMELMYFLKGLLYEHSAAKGLV